MLWVRIRFLMVVTLAVGIASGGAGVFVLGSQEPPKGARQPVAKPSTNTNAQASQPKISKQAPDQPAIDVPRARLRAQQLATRKAKAAHEIAKATRALAEIAVEEYEDVNYPQDLGTVEGEIKLADSDLTRSEDRVDWARRMFDKGYVSKAQKESEELSLKKAVFTVEQAQSKKRVLVAYSQDTVKKLKSEVEKAHSDELAKEATWNLEKAKEIDLERQLGLRTN